MPFSVYVIFQPKVDENYIVLFLADVLLQNWLKWFCDTCGTIFFQSKNGRQGFWTTSGTINFVQFCRDHTEPKTKKDEITWCHVG